MKIVRLEDAKEWPEIKSLTPEQMKEAYALARSSFTAYDLQKFTEVGEGVPFAEFLADLEQAQEQHDRHRPSGQ